jgi:hypothetical protein
VPAGPQRLADLVAVPAGQHQVEQNEVRVELRRRREDGLPVACHPDLVALPTHEELQRDHDVRLVVADEDACHRWSLLPLPGRRHGPADREPDRERRTPAVAAAVRHRDRAAELLHDPSADR